MKLTNGKQKRYKRFKSIFTRKHRVKGVGTGIHSKTKWVKK